MYHRIKRVVFFQPRIAAKINYKNSNGFEQTWVPWFAPTLAAACNALKIAAEIVDARVDPNWREKLFGMDQNDLLAVSVITGRSIEDSIQASIIAKQRGSLVVWGGPHVSIFPIDTLRQSPADIVISGHGYWPFLELLSLINKEDGKINYSNKNILFKSTNNVEIVHGKSNSDQIVPPQDLDLIKHWEPYINYDIAIEKRVINFVTTEGCPRSCTFCSEPQNSNHFWNARPVEQSIEVATKLVYLSSATGLKLHDPNFFHDLSRAHFFAKNFFSKAAVPWAATIYPDDLLNMDNAILNQLSKLGLRRLLIGLESPNTSIVKLSGKKYNPHLIPLIATKLKSVGVCGMFTFIVGWPDAPESHYEDTVRCAFNILKVWDEHQAKIHFLEPWPGTPIYNLLQKRGFTFPRSLQEWANIDYYQAQYMEIHDKSKTEMIRIANSKLSPYVDA
jgi:anaerobic magnesium-protoporphyrin IX monomethyl ester cyclase